MERFKDAWVHKSSSLNPTVHCFNSLDSTAERNPHKFRAVSATWVLMGPQARFKL